MTSTPWGGLVSYKPSTSSTMDDAQALEDSGWPEGSLAWAGYQSAGRGRHSGRTWRAEPDASLLFTVYWRPERFAVPSFAPSLTVGLGLCRWLESLSSSLQGAINLKWPNDVYWNDAKLAGILVRRRLNAGPGSIHAGIGLNLAPPQGEGFRTVATSLVEVGLALSPVEALESLLPHLASALAESQPRLACEQWLWRLNDSFSVTLPDGSVRSGLVRGLDEAGSLVLEGPSGRDSISSGE